MAIFDFLLKRKRENPEIKADTPLAMPESAKVDAGVDSTVASVSADPAEPEQMAAEETVQESVPEVPQNPVEGDGKPEQAAPAPADNGIAASHAVKEEIQQDQEQNGSDQAELDKLRARYAKIPYHGTLQTLKAKNPDIKWSAIDHIAAASGISTLKFLRANTNIFGEPGAAGAAKDAQKEHNNVPKKKAATKAVPQLVSSAKTMGGPVSEAPGQPLAVDQTAGIYERPIYRVEEIDISSDEAADYWIIKRKWDKLYVSDYIGGKKHIILPASVNGEKVYGITGDSIKSFTKCRASAVEIPGCYGEIDAFTFYENLYIEKVTIGEGIKTIHESAFIETYYLTEINLSRSAVQLESGAFFKAGKNCWQGEYKIISGILTDYAATESVMRIPEGVTAIVCLEDRHSSPHKSRGECPQIAKIILPDSLIILGDHAFYDNRFNDVQSVEGGSSLTYVGSEVFGKDSLMSKTINEPVTIGTHLFRYQTQQKNVVIPPFVQSIEKECFMGQALETVTLPPHLRNISEKAFYRCKNLQMVDMPDTVTLIGAEAFAGCEKLKEIHCGKGLKSIGNFAFRGCRQLRDSVMPEGLETIGSGAFKSCEMLKTMCIPDSVRTIGSNAFEGCVKMAAIQLPARLQEIGKEAFVGCTALASITIPEGTERIEERAFADCTSLAQVIAPAYIPFTGQGAFVNTAYSVQAKETGGGFTVVGGVLTEYTAQKKTVVVPETVTEIAETAFKSARFIESLTLPGSIRKIKYNIFGTIPGYDPTTRCYYDYYKFELNDLVLKNGLVSIEDFGFYLCPLKRLHLPDTLEKIGKFAFTGVQIPVIWLPRSVKKVGSGAFWGAKEMTVYDTIEPDAAPAAEWQYDEQRGTLNSALGCTMIFATYRNNGLLEDAKWVSHHITVLSAETGEIKYRLYCDKSERLTFRELWVTGWGKNASFKLKEYDTYFKHASSSTQRDEMAFDRLQYPYELLPEHRAMYETYLERCLYITQSAKRVADMIARKDDVSRLQLLEKRNAIGKRNLRWLLESAEKNHAEKCAAWIKKYAEEGSEQA